LQDERLEHEGALAPLFLDIKENVKGGLNDRSSKMV
jgi:hypothetical protein